MSPSFPWLTVIILGVMAAIAYRCGHNRGRLVELLRQREETLEQEETERTKAADNSAFRTPHSAITGGGL